MNYRWWHTPNGAQRAYKGSIISNCRWSNTLKGVLGEYNESTISNRQWCQNSTHRIWRSRRVQREYNGQRNLVSDLEGHGKGVQGEFNPRYTVEGLAWF